MKFYEIDLTQCMPFEVNEAFIDGFELFYKQLFERDEAGALARDYSRSCLGCSTLESCGFMTDAQIKTRIEEAGLTFYPLNSHDVNAAFLWAVNNIAKGTQDWASEFAKYAANSSDVVAEFIADGYPAFHYGIKVSGEISGSANAGTIYTRILDGLKALGTAHTVCDAVLIEESGTTMNAFKAITAEDVSVMTFASVPLWFDIRLDSYGSSRTKAMLALRRFSGMTLEQASVVTSCAEHNDPITGASVCILSGFDFSPAVLGPFADEKAASAALQQLQTAFTNAGATGVKMTIVQRPAAYKGVPLKKYFFKSSSVSFTASASGRPSDDSLLCYPTTGTVEAYDVDPLSLPYRYAPISLRLAGTSQIANTLSLASLGISADYGGQWALGVVSNTGKDQTFSDAQYIYVLVMNEGV